MQTPIAPPQAPPKPAPMPMTTTAPASRGSRLLAAIVDFAAFLCVYAALLLNSMTIFVVGICALIAIQIYFLSSRGQTIGKMVMNIKIVKVDTNKNGGFGANVLMRGIVNGILTMIPLYSLVDVLFIFREDRRCIHDMIAGTRVVEA
jgi:uncharacterized RDD family membrane protein YckC